MIAPTTVCDYDGNIKNQNFHINLIATDHSESGISDTFYTINLGPIKRVSIDGYPFITTEGLDHVLQFWSRDNAGNQESVQTISQIKLDKTSPHEIIDISGLSGRYVESSTSRLIEVQLRDNLLLANTVTLKFFREGLDSIPQSQTLQLDIAGANGIYKGYINENPTTSPDVVRIKYWIEGSDAAGNEILIGGSEHTPFVQYNIIDFLPIFRPIYKENTRIGQTKTVKNDGYTNVYSNGQFITLEITLNKTTFAVSANFSDIDSNYQNGDEVVLNIGNGVFRICYQISENNSIEFLSDITIPIKATDGTNISTDTSFEASITRKLSLLDAAPEHNSQHLSIDSSIVLNFNDTLYSDGLLTGHIYLTDSCNCGVPIDIDVIDSNVFISPVYRLKPGNNYILHVNPGTPSINLGEMDHYNEIKFSTDEFFAPLVPAGYVVTNANDEPLSIRDRSLKIYNGKNMSITWTLISNDTFNGGDLRSAPIMVSDYNSAILWTDELASKYTKTAEETILKIRDLTGLEYPKIISSDTNEILFYGGIIRDNSLIESLSYVDNELTIRLNEIKSIFVNKSEEPRLISDGQACFIRLAWCIPTELDYGYVKLVRRSDRFPQDYLDGTIIYNGRYRIWYDVGLPTGETQYYSLFVFDNENRQYSFNIKQDQKTLREWKISYDYGEYETNLMRKLQAFDYPCSYMADVCDNAVKDLANNGNTSGNVPVYYEYRLGRNSQDKTNLIVSHCDNKIEIELDKTLASNLKNACELFMVIECGAAVDSACNTSYIAMFDNIIETSAPCTEFPLLHTKPERIR